MKHKDALKTTHNDGDPPLREDFIRAQWQARCGLFAETFCDVTTANDFLRSLDRLMTSGDVLKCSNTTRVVRSRWNGLDIVIKRYNSKGLWHSLRHTLKGSRARHCWRFGRRLAEIAIPSAAPLAMVEDRIAGRMHQSYIVNTFIEGDQLKAFINNPDVSGQDKKQVVEKVERILEQLGHHRLTHSDMKPVNLLVCRGQPVLIDLDSMRQHRLPIYFGLRYRKMVRQFHRRLYESYRPKPSNSNTSR